MALKGKLTDAAAPKDAPKEDPPAPSREDTANTTVLELALYTIYSTQGMTYEKGKPYRFSTEDAIQLMAEQDAGRPVWKLYRPPVKKREMDPEVQDARTRGGRGTQAASPVPVEESTPTPTKKRIEVGTDEEIKDILNRTDEGDVTV